MPSEDELRSQLKRLGAVLDERTRQHDILEGYYQGACPFPPAIQQARVTRAYRQLMPVSEAAWGSLVVDSVLDRLEVGGIRDTEKAPADAVWGLWQDNAMDAESKLAHNASLLDGRVHALIWPDRETKRPEISLDDSTQMVVQYQEGSRRKRVAAMRRWSGEDRRLNATLYRPDGIYKFRSQVDWASAGEVAWERRTEKLSNGTPEPWPVPNPYAVVPVVELAVNRRLKPGSFGFVAGEYENHIGLIDRVNLLTFLGLVVAFWLGFPLRGVIGQRVMKDDDDNPIAPFDAHADKMFVLENPEAKIAEYAAADRKNLSIFPELSQLAMLTKTPRHYFPQEGGLSNISADTIRADEGALAAKVTGHKATLGEGWEEVLRVGGKMLEEPVELSPRAELEWLDHESRSLAERADAASKLKDILPWQAVAQIGLNATADQISRWEVQRTSDAFGTLLAATQNGAESTAPAPAQPAAP